MGGYGALRLAFLHPELFGSVTAQSAALIEKLPEFKATTRNARHACKFSAASSARRPIAPSGIAIIRLTSRAPQISAD